MNALLKPNRLYKDFDLSFQPHPETKDLAKKVDVNAVKQSLISLIYTQFNERLFQPNIGTPLYKLLFEPVDVITTEALRVGIELTIRNHEPRVILHSLALVPKEDDNSYEITISFSIIGLATPVNFTTILKRLR